MFLTSAAQVPIYQFFHIIEEFLVFTTNLDLAHTVMESLVFDNKIIYFTTGATWRQFPLPIDKVYITHEENPVQ